MVFRRHADMEDFKKGRLRPAAQTWIIHNIIIHGFSIAVQH